MVCKKESIQKVIDLLPPKASIEEVMERLYLLGKIEKGIQEADEVKVLPHEEVKHKLGKWLE